MEQYGAMLLRLILGVIYIMHAYLAVAVYGPAGMMAFQAKNHVPFPELATWYLIVAHGIGGICLVLGLLTRWAALINVPVMLGALLFVHLQKGFWVFNGGYEFALVLVVASLAQALLGPGALAVRR